MLNSVSHWHIAGLGAIGSLCNASALRNGLTVTPIVRNNSNSYCNYFVDLSGIESNLSTPVTLANLYTVENLLVPLKSYDVIPFIESVKDKLGKNAQIILCHNGMGTIEAVQKLLPSSANLYFCTSSHGVFKQDRIAKYAGAGESQWQIIYQGNDQVLNNEQMSALLPNAQQCNDLEKLLWQKLIINCAINPLTAIYKVKNGTLANLEFESKISNVVSEAVITAQACGVQLEYQSMLDKVYQVIDLTAANTSSMLQDIKSNKATEIDFITGYLLTEAERYNIPTPENKKLFATVKALG